MKKIIKLYKSFSQKNKKFTTFLYVIIFILFIITLVYNIYKKLKQKTIYVGCLYSKTGVIGEASYDNYKIIVDSFKYAVKKYECNINIIPIYTDLGDNLDNFSKWVEECVKKYNIKYFFGCWRSDERRQVIPILEKYNLKLFYPLQYEGFESSNNVYYFGACPNQQIIPGLKYMFDTYYYYKEVYVIGSDYSYPQISLKLIQDYISDTKNTYGKKLVYSKLYPLDETEFTEFITTICDKSPKGAIIINLINGSSYDDFNKKFYDYYTIKFPYDDVSLTTNQNKAVTFFSQPDIPEHIRFTDRYPSISTSIVENNIKIEDIKYFEGTLYVWNFSNEVINNPIYYLTQGYKKSDDDVVFLKNYSAKQNKAIGDTQYCSFLSALFFVNTCKQMIDNNDNIYDVDVYDKNKEITIYSACGEHVFRPNNHITKIFFILQLDISGKLYIRYQSLNSILPAPYSVLTNKILTAESRDKNISVADRLYQ